MCVCRGGGNGEGEKQDDLMASNLFPFQENGGEGEAVGRGEGGREREARRLNG